MSISECAIHFWQKALPAGKMLGRLDYTGTRHVLGAPVGFTNVVRNVPWSAIDKTVYGNYLTENRWREMLQS